MEILEKKYINLISSRLRNFKWKTTTLANFACPICGDSTKDKTKSRGYLFLLKQHYCYKCHNCSASVRFTTLLKKTDPSLYSQFVMERFKENPSLLNQRPSQGFVEGFPDKMETKRRISYGEAFEGLIPISKFNVDHPAKAYLLQRKIPLKYQRILFYAEDFGKWATTHFPQYEHLPNDPRIIIPFFERNGVDVIGFQGRALMKTALRYISLRHSENVPFIFGLERINFNNTVYVTEGPFDSLFVNNCLAMATAGKKMSLPPEKTVFIYDNEPRNSQIVGYMRSALDDGFSVVVWPKTIKEKDINDMVVRGGLTEDAVASIISENTFSGLAGLAKISQWSK